MNYKKITTSTDGIFDHLVQIKHVRLVAGSDAATALLYDATTATGDEFVKLSAGSAETIDSSRWSGMGLTASKGLSVTLSGTSPILYVYYE